MLNNSENLMVNVSVCLSLDGTLSNILAIRLVYTEEMTPCFISFVLVITSSQRLRAMKEMAASC